MVADTERTIQGYNNSHTFIPPEPDTAAEFTLTDIEEVLVMLIGLGLNSAGADWFQWQYNHKYLVAYREVWGLDVLNYMTIYADLTGAD